MIQLGQDMAGLHSKASNTAGQRRSHESALHTNQHDVNPSTMIIHHQFQGSAAQHNVHSTRPNVLAVDPSNPSSRTGIMRLLITPR